jgi:sodium transport system permease protein
VNLVGKAQREIQQVMILGGENSPRITKALHAFSGIEIVPARPDAKDEIVDKKIRAAVRIPAGFDAAIEKDESSKIEVEYYKGDMKSEFASGSLQKFLGDYRERIAKEELAARNLPTGLLDPFQVDAENVAPPEKVGGSTLGGMIPYFIIILCLTGAMYPAMDLTAGEKERGTMETILCSPISRTDLVFGKFFMVLTASLATAFLSITSMAVSFIWAKKALAGAAGEGNPFTVALDPRGVLAVIVMVLPLSVLFSAALLAIALFAKSYREAQTYVTPLTFIVILPALASILPGIELNAKTALIPILSTSLVSKEIVSGNHPWGYIALVFCASCIYAGIALSFAVRLFNREDVLFRV